MSLILSGLPFIAERRSFPFAVAFILASIFRAAGGFDAFFCFGFGKRSPIYDKTSRGLLSFLSAVEF